MIQFWFKIPIVSPIENIKVEIIQKGSFYSSIYIQIFQAILSVYGQENCQGLFTFYGTTTSEYVMVPVT